jgi:hypothetical protein
MGVIMRLGRRALPPRRAIALELLRELSRAIASARYLFRHLTNAFELFLQKILPHRRF